MKTTRKVFAFIFLIIMVTLFGGCADRQEETHIDNTSMINELLEKVEFEDELSAVDDTVIKKLYNIEDFVNAQVYISSGATSEEIAVFEFDNKKAAVEGLEKAQARIEEQKADFASYIPKEVQKLERAVIRQSGKYVIVCVSNSDEAEKIITKYLSK